MVNLGYRRLEAVARAAAFSAARRVPVESAASIVRRRLIGSSRWAGSAPALIAVRASRPGPLVVHGEPGAGKRFVARLLHDAGPWAARPFVEISAAELTDAALVALALGDETAVMPLSARAELEQLLARVDGGTIYVSGAGALAGDVVSRALSGDATAGRPHVAATSGTARVLFGMDESEANVRGLPAGSSDVLRVPPLRERPEDIEYLAEHFVAEVCARLDKETRTLSPAVIGALRRHDWPGNVAELRRTIDQMIRRAGPPVLEPAHLPAILRGHGAWTGNDAGSLLDTGINLHDEVERYERSLLTAALERSGGVQTRAAEQLGLKISTLNSKLSAHGIDARAYKIRARASR